MLGRLAVCGSIWCPMAVGLWCVGFGSSNQRTADGASLSACSSDVSTAGCRPCGSLHAVNYGPPAKLGGPLSGREKTIGITSRVFCNFLFSSRAGHQVIPQPACPPACLFGPLLVPAFSFSLFPFLYIGCPVASS